MLPNSVTLSAASTSHDSDIELIKRSEQNGTSTYTGTYTVDGSLVRDVLLEVKHTRPIDRSKKGSTLVRATTTYYNSLGEYDKTVRVWTVIDSKDFQGNQGSYAETIQHAFLDHPMVRDELFGGSY